LRPYKGLCEHGASNHLPTFQFHVSASIMADLVLSLLQKIIPDLNTYTSSQAMKAKKHSRENEVVEFLYFTEPGLWFI